MIAAQETEKMEMNKAAYGLFIIVFGWVIENESICLSVFLV